MPRTSPTEGSSTRGDNLLAARTLASSKLGKSADQNANELTTDSVNIFKVWVSPNRAKRLVYGDSQKEKESKGEIGRISARDRRILSRRIRCPFVLSRLVGEGDDSLPSRPTWKNGLWTSRGSVGEQGPDRASSDLQRHLRHLSTDSCWIPGIVPWRGAEQLRGLVTVGDAANSRFVRGLPFL